MRTMRPILRREEVLQSAEVAGLIGLSKRTLLNWLRSGKIPSPRRDPVTGWYRWTAADVDAARRAVLEAVR